MWEGIGIVSYLLINFWFTRIQANKAAILALVMNRVGDMGLSIGFFAIFALFGSLDYAAIFSLAPFMNGTAITIIGLLLLTGAMAKSAQIPLHSWLPGSMEGYRAPTTIIFLYLYMIFFYTLILYLCLQISPKFIELIHTLFGPSYLSNFNLFYLANILPISLPRDSKGRFLPRKLEIEPLPDKLKQALVGDLLGDGYLGYRKKDKNGKVIGNVIYAMTLKMYDYADYLLKEIYSPICTNNSLRPWPNPKTGQTPKQYTFSSRALASLTQIHKDWYIWSNILNKFIKIVPLNISELLTPIGLAHWIMGDGYFSENTVYLCTDNFTKEEVDLLILTLNTNFGLKASLKRRIKSNKEVCWRIRFSSQSENILKLRSLVLPYIIDSMKYKLGVTVD